MAQQTKANDMAVVLTVKMLIAQVAFLLKPHGLVKLDGSLVVCQRLAADFVKLELIEGMVQCSVAELAPDAPKGSGRQLGRAALNHAFRQLKFHKVCGQALAYNQRSIQFHQSLGFEQEGILRDQHFDGERYHHVICFGLLSHEWQPNP